MKKIIFGIVGIMSVMIPTLADVSSDTAKLKAACKASDKTLWVERNQVCIPKNPCKDSKFEQYCNRDFRDYQSPKGSNMYVHLINLYANAHGLSCSAVPQDAKWAGQDFVVCQGTDIMVFEFDDIENKEVLGFLPGVFSSQLSSTIKALCLAVGGKYEQGEHSKEFCRISEAKCPYGLNNAIEDYVDVMFYNKMSDLLKLEQESNYCVIVSDTTEWGEVLDAAQSLTSRN